LITSNDVERCFPITTSFTRNVETSNKRWKIWTCYKLLFIVENKHIFFHFLPITFHYYFFCIKKLLELQLHYIKCVKSFNTETFPKAYTLQMLNMNQIIHVN
jgi:hypothetical protein